MVRLPRDRRAPGESSLGFPTHGIAYDFLEALPPAIGGENVCRNVFAKHRNILPLPSLRRWTRSALLVGLLPISDSGRRLHFTTPLSRFSPWRPLHFELRDCRPHFGQLGVRGKRKLHDVLAKRSSPNRSPSP